MTAYVQLSKYGDILSILPILQNERETTGEKPVLIVAEDYASITEGVEFLTADIYKGHWQDLAGAILYAKKRYDKVVVPQTHGLGFPIQQDTPSFQYSQWKRADALYRWDTLPVTLPRTNIGTNIHVDGLVFKDFDKDFKFLLYADHSQSSPFPHKEDLAKHLSELSNELGFRFVRLSEIKMGHIFDLLSLYDRASLLVTIETMHIHLSKASHVPTIVLATDTPSIWHGSAWSKKFEYYIRYGDYLTKKQDLLRQCREVVSGVRKLQSVRITSGRNSYNPSAIVSHDVGDIFLSRRTHPDTSWRTDIILEPLEGAFPTLLNPPDVIKSNSIEDMRLFVHQGQLMGSYTVALTDTNVARCVNEYCTLEKVNSKWIMGARWRPKYPGNDFSGLEKNWTYFSHKERLYCIYGIVGDDQRVLEISGDTVVKTIASKSPSWNWGQIRGGALVKWKGKMLRLFHSRLGKGHKHYEFTYYVGAALMNPEPPFETLAVSKSPILEGDEHWTPNCHHWKPRVVFPGGAIVEGDNVVLYYGRNDCECRTVILKEKDFNL